MHEIFKNINNGRLCHSCEALPSHCGYSQIGQVSEKNKNKNKKNPRGQEQKEVGFI